MSKDKNSNIDNICEQYHQVNCQYYDNVFTLAPTCKNAYHENRSSYSLLINVDNNDQWIWEKIKKEIVCTKMESNSYSETAFLFEIDSPYYPDKHFESEIKAYNYIICQIPEYREA